MSKLLGALSKVSMGNLFNVCIFFIHWFFIIKMRWYTRNYCLNPTFLFEYPRKSHLGNCFVLKHFLKSTEEWVVRKLGSKCLFKLGNSLKTNCQSSANCLFASHYNSCCLWKLQKMNPINNWTKMCFVLRLHFDFNLF